MSRLADLKMAGVRMLFRGTRGFDALTRRFGPGAEQELQDAVNKGARSIAEIFREELSDRYRRGDTPGHARLHPFTVAQKGGRTQPLFDQGFLADAVVVVTRKQGDNLVEHTIGVPPGRHGMKALIAENGLIIKVTPKMRRFLAARGLRLRRSTRFLTVPARPVLAEALQRGFRKMDNEMLRHIRIEFVGPRFGI